MLPRRYVYNKPKLGKEFFPKFKNLQPKRDNTSSKITDHTKIAAFLLKNSYGKSPLDQTSPYIIDKKVTSHEIHQYTVHSTVTRTFLRIFLTKLLHIFGGSLVIVANIQIMPPA